MSDATRVIVIPAAPGVRPDAKTGIPALQDAVRNLDSAVGALQTGKQDKIADLATIRAGAQSGVQALGVLNSKSATWDAAASSVSTIASSVAVLGSSVTVLASSVSAVDSRVAVIEGKEGTWDAAASSVATIASSVTVLASSVSAVDSRVTVIEGKEGVWDAAASSVSTIASSVAALGGRVDGVESSVGTLADEVADVVGAVTTLSSSVSAISSSVSSVAASVTTLSSSVTGIAIDVDILDAAVSRIERGTLIVGSYLSGLGLETGRYTTCEPTSGMDPIYFAPLSSSSRFWAELWFNISSGGATSWSWDPSYPSAVSIDSGLAPEAGKWNKYAIRVYTGSTGSVERIEQNLYYVGE